MLEKDMSLIVNQMNILDINKEIKKEVLKIPNYIISSKESKRLYKHIRSVLRHFDTNFNNTVVDTYAFDKVLKSDDLVNVIYYYLMNRDLGHFEIKGKITIYILSKVEAIYSSTKHKIFKPGVYLAYVDHVLDELLDYKNTI